MRAANTYRGARRNACFRPTEGKGSVWRGIKPRGTFQHPPARLNRSKHWPYAATYRAARAKSPFPESEVV